MKKLVLFAAATLFCAGMAFAQNPTKKQPAQKPGVEAKKDAVKAQQEPAKPAANIQKEATADKKCDKPCEKKCDKPCEKKNNTVSVQKDDTKPAAKPENSKPNKKDDARPAGPQKSKEAVKSDKKAAEKR